MKDAAKCGKRVIYHFLSKPLMLLMVQSDSWNCVLSFCGDNNVHFAIQYRNKCYKPTSDKLPVCVNIASFGT